MRTEFFPRLPDDIHTMRWVDGYPLIGDDEVVLPVLCVKRTLGDYTEKNDYGPPPNFRRALLEKGAVDRLLATFKWLQRSYPGKYEHFTIFQRFLEKIDGENEYVFPWDIVMHVIIDGIVCYLPINVSFSHTVMSCNWSEVDTEDFNIKRQLLERQLVDMLFPKNGPETGIYGVCFPEQFAQGKTARIFENFPSSDLTEKQETREELKPIKIQLVVNGKPYVMFFFIGVGLRGERARFEKMVGSEAVLRYCIEMASVWEYNFQSIKHDEDDFLLRNLAIARLTASMGALQLS